MSGYTLTAKQYNELAGLAFHRANSAYNDERGELNEGEREQDADNIKQHFPALDALGVPYWVQNIVLVWAENWRYPRNDDERDRRRGGRMVFKMVQRQYRRVVDNSW